jgi:DNA-binding MarR family transcriptional regulator
MDPIKEAFQRIKEDISALQQQILELKDQVSILTEIQTNNAQNTPTQTDIQTDQTDDQPLEPPYHQNNPFSTGNGGVQTDRQTNRQTDQQTENTPNLPSLDDFERAGEIIESLDTIKKEIRRKFKRLTPQEMLVFSALYTLEEQNTAEITYKLLADNLKLSESSIRDYINKLAKKGIPIDKIRQNNKTILLKISPDLKKIATLATISQLRGL